VDGERDGIELAVAGGGKGVPQTEGGQQCN
jgi:hypothetical protein